MLAACSSAASQQWSYHEDGLLRSAAEPTLCLAADAGRHSVALAGCVVHAGEVRYDLTVRGELLLRDGKGKRVAPGKGKDVTVTARDGSARQRWTLEVEEGTGLSEKQGASPRPPNAPNAPRDTPKPPPGDPGPQQNGQRYEERFAQVGSEHEPAQPSTQPPTLPRVTLAADRALPARLLNAVTAAVGPAPH